MIVQEIQDLKQGGYSLNEVRDHLVGKMGKRAPSMPTIRKYYNMDGVPEDLHARTAKPHAFDYVVAQRPLAAGQGVPLGPLVVDEPLEQHVVDRAHVAPGVQLEYLEHRRAERLDGWLRETGQVAEPERSRRLYDHVDDPPAGRQLQLDFGQAKCDGGLTVHFLCMLLRMSRYLGVCAQDHRFDSEEACAAIYRFMCKIGGRPEELVIDQDSVFVGSETYGEVFATECRAAHSQIRFRPPTAN